MPRESIRNSQHDQTRFDWDPFRYFETPVAAILLTVTVFVMIWKSLGLDWLPMELGERFQEVFTHGYYPRNDSGHEQAYNAFFFMLYGVLGTMAQSASLRISTVRAQPDACPGILRYIYATFHLLIGIYHVLFVFRIVEGKLRLDAASDLQMLLTRFLYLATLALAIELIVADRSTFFRRKVCLDLVSLSNSVPLLIFWAFATVGYQDDSVTSMIGIACFVFLPLAIIAIELFTWQVSRMRASR